MESPATHISYSILRRRILVRSSIPVFTQQVRRLFRSFPQCEVSTQFDCTGHAPDVTFSVTFASNPHRYTFSRNGQPIASTASGWHLLRLLECELEAFLADDVRDFYLLHAGAVACNGAGIIFPAVSGSGKSSLVLALLMQGYRYLSDELAVIDPATNALHAFPKPLSIKNTTIFPDLVYQNVSWCGPDGDETPEGAVWYIHPCDINDQSSRVSSAPVPVRFIIFPCYDGESVPCLQPLSAGQALRRLFQNTFNAIHFDNASLPILARLVKQAHCFELSSGSLAQTTALIEQVTAYE